eukprot:373412_1
MGTKISKNEANKHKSGTSEKILLCYEKLMHMGFDENESLVVAQKYKGDIIKAIDHLTSKHHENGDAIKKQKCNIDDNKSDTKDEKADGKEDNESTVLLSAVCNDDTNFNLNDNIKIKFNAKSQIQMYDLIHQVKIEIEKSLNPVQIAIYRVNNHNVFNNNNFDIIFSKTDVQSLNVCFYIEVEHETIDFTITCPNMEKADCDNPLLCPIYKAMKVHHIFGADKLEHLIEFSHFRGRNAVPSCRYNQNCHSFKRIKNGGYRIDDRSHMLLYRHPPRRHDIKLSQAINSFMFISDDKEHTESPIHDLYKPTEQDREKYWCNNEEGWLKALLEEVSNNGRKSDLHVHETGLSIMTVVDEKMKHVRHKTFGTPLRKDQMLALILYTGCQCNYELCKTQRNGDYKTWKWLDLCLYTAINGLWRREKGTYKLYSGLANVKLDKKLITNGYFVTYTSTSWSKDVALRFLYQYGDTGMLIEMDKDFRNNTFNRCCDVSWISKYPDECEVLMARGGQFVDNCDFKRFCPVSGKITEFKKSDDDVWVNELMKPLHKPTQLEKQKYWKNKRYGWAKAVIEEITKNGYDKYLPSSVELKEIIDYHYQKWQPLLQIDHILVLVIWTGFADISRDIAITQGQKNNYEKWKWFDLVFYSALWRLSMSEKGRDYKSFMCISVQLGAEIASLATLGCFKSYVSTTQEMMVANQQMGWNDSQTMLELIHKFQKKTSNIMCDLSPFSRFPQERELVIARSCNVTQGAWEAKVMDEKMFDDYKDRETIQIVKIQEIGHFLHSAEENIADCKDKDWEYTFWSDMFKGFGDEQETMFHSSDLFNFSTQNDIDPDFQSFIDDSKNEPYASQSVKIETTYVNEKKLTTKTINKNGQVIVEKYENDQLVQQTTTDSTIHIILNGSLGRIFECEYNVSNVNNHYNNHF